MRQREHILNLTKELESLLAELGGYEPETENKNQSPVNILTQQETISLSEKARQIMQVIETGK